MFGSCTCGEFYVMAKGKYDGSAVNLANAELFFVKQEQGTVC